MKSNDLMIGDWVQNPHGLKGRVRSIKYIPKDNADNYGGYSLLELVFSESTQTFPINDAKPIPLTPEILEKNGFERGSDNLFSYGRGMYVMMWSKGHYSVGQIFGNWSAFVEFAEIRFIHELQHALRLIGIDKTIEL